MVGTGYATEDRVMNSDQEQLLTIVEAAQRLNVKKRTLEAWIREGKVQGIRLGRLHRIKRSVVDRLVHEGMRSPTPNG